ncbi:MAG: M23 family metallopeptidase [candidate division Zixibacteria bacterium]|nr:M23 family metallopeptidase [candidate division Zixibacteria bacterium]
MALRKRLTLVLIPHSHAPVREFGSLALICGVLLIMLTGYGIFGHAVPYARSLWASQNGTGNSAGNRPLSLQLEEMKTLVATLRAQMGEMVEREQAARLAVGLPHIDLDVRKVGVGGPETPGSKAPAGTVGQVQADLEQLLREAKLQNASLQSIIRKAQADKTYWRHIPTVRPVEGTTTSTFGMRSDPFTGLRRMHAGYDIAARPGEKVRATADGVIVNIGMDVNYGRFIEIDHRNGYMTRYGHLSKVIGTTGARTSRGDIIGHVGNSGRASGYHLHYEVHRNGRIVDPAAYFFPENEIVD